MADQAAHLLTEEATPAAGHFVFGDNGTGTRKFQLDKLPIPAAAAEALEEKASTDELSASVQALNAQLIDGLAAKQDSLTVVGGTLVGGTLTIDAGKVAGSIVDGKSWIIVIASSGAQAFGVFANVLGTATTVTPSGSPTNAWNAMLLGRVQASAGTGNMARLYTVGGLRFATDNSAYQGFKWWAEYAANDTLTTAHRFVGFTQQANLPGVGTHPSTWTGQRFGLQIAGDDTNRWWKLVYRDGGGTTTVIQDLGASFPCDGQNTNPIRFEVESIPNATGVRVTKWKVTNKLTLAVAQGTLEGTGPNGNWETNNTLIADSNGSATQATFMSTGMGCGGWYNLVVGERLDLPAPVRITGATTLTRALHANVEHKVESATPILLTVANSGYLDGDQLFGVNEGAGDVTFALEGGGTIQKHADLPAAVEQWQGYALTYNGTANRWVRTA